MTMVIRTNNVPRDLVYDHELTPKERAEFDYLDWPAIDEGRDSATFFRYKGELTDLGTVMRTDPSGELCAAGWEGCVAWSAFNGLLVKFTPDCDQLIVAYFYR